MFREITVVSRCNLPCAAAALTGWRSRSPGSGRPCADSRGCRRPPAVAAVGNEAQGVNVSSFSSDAARMSRPPPEPAPCRFEGVRTAGCKHFTCPGTVPWGMRAHVLVLLAEEPCSRVREVIDHAALIAVDWEDSHSSGSLIYVVVAEQIPRRVCSAMIAAPLVAGGATAALNERHVGRRRRGVQVALRRQAASFASAGSVPSVPPFKGNSAPQLQQQQKDAYSSQGRLEANRRRSMKGRDTHATSHGCCCGGGALPPFVRAAAAAAAAAAGPSCSRSAMSERNV